MSNLRQVGIVSDHFWGIIGSTSCRNHWGFCEMSRIRHCIECPNCRTRYLISFSPYGNGSYLVTTMYGSTQEHALYCFCRGGTRATRWSGREVMACEVSKAAYERGYGTTEEIWPINNGRQRPSFDPSTYERNWKPTEKRKSSV